MVGSTILHGEESEKSLKQIQPNPLTPHTTLWVIALAVLMLTGVVLSLLDIPFSTISQLITSLLFP